MSARVFVAGRAAALAAALSVAAAALAPSPSAAESRPRYGGSVAAGLLGEPVHVDPAHARSHAELTLAGLLFDALYRIGARDAGGRVQLEPHLAAALPSVEATASGALARIPIRPGVMFHDGRALSAADVLASLRRLGTTPARWVLSDVRRIERDGDAVLLHLDAAATSDAERAALGERLALALSASASAITPGGAVPRASNPVGSGPFRVRAVDRRRRRIQLAAHDAHFAGRPYLDSLELRWFEDASGEAAAYEVGALALSQRGAVAYPGHRPKHQTVQATGPTAVLVYAGAGRRARMRSAAARRALSLALDRSGMRGIGTGERVEPALTPVPASLGGAGADAAAHQPRMSLARDALRQARADDSELDRALARGQELEILVDRSRPDDREIAETVAAALFRLGVRARITELPARGVTERVSRGDADLYIGHLSLPVPDAALVRAAAGQRVGELEIIPLLHRAVRVHHRSDLRGVTLDELARPDFADAYFFGAPARGE
ncbi:ABC transporter substrate-binding protein [Haliangium ochraceum]|uniref:Extracellular solute-binding protein family 5 n=1 Tax=Haliangium ochraceum (strain DSM 14365 / JCM 11303 / SMP-2) TaxID=502025 RepID=D0LNM6_HALO1|nr:ABC transporter substrate-binding protein [Haliangium ochraceum]ACY16931.1 extracellular solute-binding protein family 5 [Haliangium ochraceum DSM 14365]